MNLERFNDSRMALPPLSDTALPIIAAVLIPDRSLSSGCMKKNSLSLNSRAASGSALWPARRLRASVAGGGPHLDHDTRFFVTHAWIPLCVFALATLLSMGLGGDLWLADRLYAWQGHGWQLRNDFVAEHLIHRLGRELSTMAWLSVLAAWIVARTRAGWAPLRRPLAYLLVSVAVSTALVAWVKSFSNMDCPWDLLRYGGDRPYVGLLSMRPLGLSRGACFPAGHASGGYAWLSLYFFAWTVRPRLRWLGLAIGVGAGLLFGLAQQLRGAHFVSHDLWTLAICWATALGLHLLFWRRGAGTRRSPAGTRLNDGAMRGMTR